MGFFEKNFPIIAHGMGAVCIHAVKQKTCYKHTKKEKKNKEKKGNFRRYFYERLTRCTERIFKQQSTMRTNLSNAGIDDDSSGSF